MSDSWKIKFVIILILAERRFGLLKEAENKLLTDFLLCEAFKSIDFKGIRTILSISITNCQLLGDFRIKRLEKGAKVRE